MKRCKEKMDVVSVCGETTSTMWPGAFVALFAVFLSVDFVGAAVALARASSNVPIKST
jgi:hypothetical protein